MQLIITASNPAYGPILYDTESREIDKVPRQRDEADRGADSSRCFHRPYGISWNDDNLFIANRRYICVYDKQLYLVDKIGPLLGQNPHQLMFDGGDLWTVVTDTDCLLRYSLASGDKHYLHVPSGVVYDELPSLGDTLHLNSAIRKDSKLCYVLGTDRRKSNSFLRKVTTRDGYVIAKSPTRAFQGHNLLVDGEDIWTLDTGRTQKVLHLSDSDKDYSLSCQADDFVRGMAATKDVVIASHFHRHARRYNRMHCNANLAVVDRDTGSVIGTHHLKGIGAVNDLRILGEADLCHHNQAKFHL